LYKQYDFFVSERDDIGKTQPQSTDGVTTRVKSPTSGGFAQREVKKDGVEIVKCPHLDNYVSSILPEPSRKTTQTGAIPDPEGSGIYVTESQTS
jgi:hypothetical protein